MKSKKTYLIKGVLKRHAEGFGFVLPEDKSHPDIYIPAGKIGSALTEDQVEVLVYQKAKGGPHSYFGFIESIVKRNTKFVFGFIKKKRGSWFLEQADLPFLSQVPLGFLKKLSVQEGDYVKVHIGYKKKAPFFKLELTENLGVLTPSAQHDAKRIMAEYNIPFAFSPEALKELKSLPNQVTKKDFYDRKDLRDKAFVTIDGETAQDFDDAIFVEKQKDSYRLYVAIADVSYYVQEDSALDQSAFERGNSTYFPGFCVPMLPEKLSQWLCSLVEGEDRLVLVVEMVFDFQGSPLKSFVYPSVICSKKRFTYTEISKHFKSFKNKKAQSKEWDFLKPAQSLGQILIQKHKKQGAFDFDFPETVVAVNSKAEPTKILKEPRLFSHKMIEQFMLSANQEVSRFLEGKKSVLIYRIHESPDVEKLKVLEKLAQTFSFSKSFQSRKNFLQFLSQYKNHKNKDLIYRLALRAMSQARYSAFNKGHYGLSFKSYTHFSSPIRRYCDLQIHRLIKKALNDKAIKNSRPWQKLMEKQAMAISATEQNSVKAERKIKDIKMARFLKPYIGETFEGSISSIVRFGLFVCLKDFFVEGLVRFQDMKSYWQVDEWGLRAVNPRTGLTLKIGDPVKVLVKSIDTTAGKIDFQLLSYKGRKLLSS